MLNEHLPTELLNLIHGIILRESMQDKHLNSLIEKFRYDYIHVAMSKVKLTFEDYYKAADEYRKNGLCEFAEALLTRCN